VKKVFADASYWVALLNPHDQLHRRAKQLEGRLKPARLLTTEFVLAEFLNYYAPRRRALRLAASALTRSILVHPHIDVAGSDRELFAAGLALYASRPDNRYSLTDCVSMVVMKKRGAREALTQDQHFRQEGFLTLLHD